MQHRTLPRAGRERRPAAGGVAGRVAWLAARAAGAPLPLRVRAWDGSIAGPAEAGLTLTLHSPRALRWLLWSPGELGAVRAYVAGDVDLDGDLLAALGDPQVVAAAVGVRRQGGGGAGTWVRLALLAARAGALGLPLRAPPEEARLAGRLHSRRRDAAAIRHHYDVGDRFYRLLLGPSMVYSCGYWTADPGAGYTVDDAQRDKLDLVCGKLGLRPGQRLLDVGCGWGGLVVHAAGRYGVLAVGITLSERQARLAREHARRAGVADRVEIRVQDYRDVADAPFDAIASVGMAEHLGAGQYPTYCARMRDLLRPGGRLLHHQVTVAHPGARRRRRNGLIGRYVFPDGELRPLGEVVRRLEDAGLETRDVEALREHYVLTLTSWAANLEASWPTACELTSRTRARIWRGYLLGCAAAFATGRVGVHQVLAVRPGADGRAALPRRRGGWLPADVHARTVAAAGRCTADRGFTSLPQTLLAPPATRLGDPPGVRRQCVPP